MKYNVRNRKGRFRKRHFAVLRKSMPAWVFLLVIAAIASVSFAMIIHVVPEEHISVYSNRIAGSNFTLSDQATVFAGPNKIVVTLDLHNIQTSTQYANVSLFLLNAQGSSFANLTEQTGAVAGTGNVFMVFYFSGKGIVQEYASDFIQVTDVSGV